MPTKKTTTTSTNTATKKPRATKSVVTEEAMQENGEFLSVQELAKNYPYKRTFLSSDMVAVTNNTRGTLVYVSKRMQGYAVIWRPFGDVEYIEYGQLMSMRNSAKAFFTNNWVTIADKEVLVALGVDKFYTHVPDVEDFDSLFRLAPQDIQDRISGMTEGMKETVALRAAELIEEGVIDSRKTIKALEYSLGRKLIEEIE